MMPFTRQNHFRRWLIAGGCALQLAGGARCQADWLNVKYWNPARPQLEAVGDGVHNDAPAIQSAIRSLPHGGTLFFPAGQYRLQATGPTPWDSSGIRTALLITHGGFTFAGEGMNRTTLIQASDRASLIYGFFRTAQSGFCVCDLKLQADVTSPGPFDRSRLPFGGVVSVDGSGGRVSGVCFSHVATDDLGKQPMIFMKGVAEVQIDHCQFNSFVHATAGSAVGPGCAHVFLGGDAGSRVVVTDNDFNGDAVNPPDEASANLIGEDGMIWVQGGESAIFTGNRIRNFRLEAINCGSRHQVITGNRFLTGKTGGSIAIRDSLYAGTNFQVLVAHNTQQGGSTFFDFAGAQAGPAEVTITDNQCQFGNPARGIAGNPAVCVGNARPQCRAGRAVLRDNSFDNAGDMGFVLSGSGSDDSVLLLEDNRLTHLAAVGSGLGVHIDGFRNVTVADNTLSGGDNGNLLVWGRPFTTQVWGQLHIANNRYFNRANQPGYWVRLQTTRTNTPFNFWTGSGIVRGSTNVGGYHVVYSLRP